MAFSYKNYEESEAVREALEAIKNHQATKPGEYQSQWTQGLQDALDKIQNRPAFSYDLTGDALYQQYKDRYVQQGQMAMLDTMGQASALTGGYGSSYGQSVGQQAYQGYLQGLSDQIPQLYQMALDKYGQEGQDLYNLYSILGEREASDYDRYQTDLSRWESALDKLYSQYNAERDYDYGKYESDRNYSYNQFIDDRNYQYQLERDKIEDARYAAAQAAARSYSSGSSGGGDSEDSGSSKQWGSGISTQKDPYTHVSPWDNTKRQLEYLLKTQGANAFFSYIEKGMGPGGSGSSIADQISEAQSKELDALLKKYGY